MLNTFSDVGPHRWRKHGFVHVLRGKVRSGRGGVGLPQLSLLCASGEGGGEKPLGLSRGLEPLHPPFPLAGQWVGMLRTVRHLSVLPMLHTRERLPLHGARAFQRIGHNHAWDVLACFEELAAAWRGRFLVPAPLHEHVEHKAALSHGPLVGVAFAVERQKAFLQGQWSPGRGRWRWSCGTDAWPHFRHHGRSASYDTRRPRTNRSASTSR